MVKVSALEERGSQSASVGVGPRVVLAQLLEQLNVAFTCLVVGLDREQELG